MRFFKNEPATTASVDTESYDEKAGSSSQVYTPAMEKRVVRKLDTHVVPLVMALCMLGSLSYYMMLLLMHCWARISFLGDGIIRRIM